MLAIWFHTVFGFTSYHHLRTLGPWRTALFALYLLLVGVLVFTLYFAWQIHRQLPTFIDKLPALTFEQGHLIGPQEKTTVSIPKTPYVLIFDASAKNPPTAQEFVDQKILAFISGNQLYMPSVAGVNAQTLPEKLSGDLTPQTIHTYEPTIRGFLQSAAFFGAFFIMGIFLLFSTLLAAAIIFFWRGIKQASISRGTLWRWAIFLQGPALILWLVQLFYGVPLFTFALFILFNIYVQQIFNTLPYSRGKYVA